MKRLIIVATLVAMLAASASVVMADKPTGFDAMGKATGQTADTGFDQYGYNRVARIFSGTGESWALAKGLPAGYLGIYAKDKLVMKWNAEWDRGNADKWLNPPYAAWENNEWNGKVEGGSGAVWHYKIVWVGWCDLDGDTRTIDWLPDGGYCIWGQFETIMDQGVDPNIDVGHLWFAHVTPTGYGAYGEDLNLIP